MISRAIGGGLIDRESPPVIVRMMDLGVLLTLIPEFELFTLLDATLNDHACLFHALITKKIVSRIA